MDQSKKTMRHFYCRDVLWETFEQMANDFDCSIDYLVNEAMRYYARSKNYQSPGGPPGATGPQVPPERPNGPSNGPSNNGPPSNGPTQHPYNKPNGPSMGPGMSRGAPATSPPQPSGMGMGSGGAAPNARRAAPPTPGYARGAPNASGAMPPAPSPAADGMGRGAAAMPGGGPTLFLVYNGQRYPVTKDQFIIGRGSKTSDLAIKDGNISRKHAAVIRRNGTFYIKDLGSTNGIDYKGMRIDNKRIDEGDVFHLCDYELRFTYRADG
jgi:hypothetical protein